MQVLEELWRSGINQVIQPLRHNPQYMEAVERSGESEKALTNSFSEEQKKLFAEYRECQNELMVVTDCETYITGFKLGAMIMLDVLIKGEVNEI